MGSGHSQDPSVNLYLELNQPFYYSGDCITGTAYMLIKNNVFYNALYLRFQGQQIVNWTTGSGDDSTSYYDKLQTHKDQFILSKSSDGYQRGHYSFPFSIKLPYNIAGSFQTKDLASSIKYLLTMRLVDYSSRNDPQSYDHQVTIVQPIKIQNRPKMMQASMEIRGCCCSSGQVVITAQFSHNIAQSGLPINIRIKVDNRTSDSQFDKLNVKFVQNVIRKTSRGEVHQSSEILKTFQTQSVRAGQIKQLNLNFQIPHVVQGTVSGRLLKNLYSIDIEPHLSSWFTDVGELKHFVAMTTNTPILKQLPNILPPQNWNPMVFAPLQYKMKEAVLEQNHNMRAMNNNYPQYPH